MKFTFIINTFLHNDAARHPCQEFFRSSKKMFKIKGDNIGRCFMAKGLGVL
jgi:hypothetical protein